MGGLTGFQFLKGAYLERGEIFQEVLQFFDEK